MDALSILALAKASKAGGGSSDPQVVFFDVTYDMLQNTASSDTTQSDIAALLEAGKYPIAKLSEANTDSIIYAPFTIYDGVDDGYSFDVVFYNTNRVFHAMLFVNESTWTPTLNQLTVQGDAQ